MTSQNPDSIKRGPCRKKVLKKISLSYLLPLPCLKLMEYRYVAQNICCFFSGQICFRCAKDFLFLFCSDLLEVVEIFVVSFLIRFVGGAQRQNAVLFAHPRAFLLPKFAKLPKVAKFPPKNLSSVRYIFG